MTGLFLLFVAVVWLVAAAAIAYASTSRIRIAPIRSLAALAVWGMLLVLPLIDELVGKQQFGKLCKENSAIHMDRTKATGRTVYLAGTSDIEVRGTWLRIVLKPWRFLDAQTREPLVTYNTLTAEGGWLIRALALSEGGAPLTFRGSCSPANRPASVQTFKALGIDYIEPPLTRAEEKK